MYICIRVIDRDIEIMNTEDDEHILQDEMYEDMCSIVGSEGELIDMIENNEAVLNKFSGSMTYKGGHYDWKILWV